MAAPSTRTTVKRILLNLKMEESEKQRLNSSADSTAASEGPPKDYEEIIQKLEGDVRNHIRIEQQLKLHIESIQYKLEEAEKLKEQVVGEL